MRFTWWTILPLSLKSESWEKRANSWLTFSIDSQFLDFTQNYYQHFKHLKNSYFEMSLRAQKLCPKSPQIKGFGVIRIIKVLNIYMNWFIPLNEIIDCHKFFTTITIHNRCTAWSIFFSFFLKQKANSHNESLGSRRDFEKIFWWIKKIDA